MYENNKVIIFSIVNDQKKFDGFKESLNGQVHVNYKLIPILNYNGEFDSARRAFNQSAENIDGTYYVFSHPDIRFLDSNALSDIMEQIFVLDDFGVVGVAGAMRKGKHGRKIITTIVQGNKKEKVGERINGITETQTVDECFFVIKGSYFQSHHFSDSPGWHLYSVEYCLEALRNGNKNYVVPARIWHMSSGASLDEKYMEQLEKLIRNYRDYFALIYTTVKAWPTKGSFAFLYRKYYWLKQRIKRII